MVPQCLLIALCTFGLAQAADVSPARADQPNAQQASPAQTQPPASQVKPPDEVELEKLDTAPTGRIIHTTEPRTGRPFSLYVPKGYDDSRAWPLLVECTGQGVGRRNIARVWQLADSFNLIVVCPDTWAVHGRPDARKAPDKTITGWSRSGQQIDVPQTVREKDVILRDLKADAEAIGRIVDVLARAYSVKPDLVALTGYSGGAWTAYYVALNEPQRYAGVCIRSGGFNSALIPALTPAARKLPVSVVIGDQDLPLVLEETAKAEEFFRREKFEDVQVERLPNSGHDNRPEVAGNFVMMLRSRVLERIRAQVRPQYEKLMENARAARQRGDTAKARQWLERAAALERQAELPPQAADELKSLDAAGESNTNQDGPKGQGAGQ